MKDRIIAVIVSYNATEDIFLNQYISLIDQVEEVIYIDNGSTNYERVYDVIRSHSSDKLPYSIIRNIENIGLGAAQNQGIRCAKKHGADFILILDHDSVLKPDFSKELLKGFHSIKSQRIGAVGPIYINESTNEIYPITKYIGPFIKRLHPHDIPVKASCLISSGSLIPIAVLEEVGGMNEDLFVDYIDIDWSYRAVSKGYELYAIPKAIMNHRIGDKRISILGRKISFHSPLRRYYLSRNSIYMLRCPYISKGYKLRELTFNLIRILVFSLISKDKKKYIKYSFRGLKDGIKGKFGKCEILE